MYAALAGLATSWAGYLLLTGSFFWGFVALVSAGCFMIVAITETD